MVNPIPTHVWELRKPPGGGADSAPPAISHVSGSVVLIFVGIVAFIEFNCSEPPKW